MTSKPKVDETENTKASQVRDGMSAYWEYGIENTGKQTASVKIQQTQRLVGSSFYQELNDNVIKTRNN